jgi:RNA polymerase sigma-70 factor, ECF subfamily
MWFRKTNLSHCNDEALMQLIAKGSAPAFELLYDRYSARLYRFFYRMLWQNAALSEDFTQDIFLKIIEKPQLFDTNRSFKSWVYTLAANKCKNAYRDKKDTQHIDNHVFELHEKTEFNLDIQKFETHLATALDALDVSVKECFVLRYLEEMSIKEIALIVDIPEGTVKSRLHYCVKKLAVELAVYKV